MLSSLSAQACPEFYGEWTCDKSEDQLMAEVLFYNMDGKDNLIIIPQKDGAEPPKHFILDETIREMKEINGYYKGTCEKNQVVVMMNSSQMDSKTGNQYQISYSLVYKKETQSQLTVNIRDKNGEEYFTSCTYSGPAK